MLRHKPLKTMNMFFLAAALFFAGTFGGAFRASAQPALGGKFMPEDIDWKNPVYCSQFDTTSDLNAWKLEGGKQMSIRDGKLVLESPPGALTASDNTGHLVCWLTNEIPADFMLEFSVRPQDKRQGLGIVFFNTRGTNSESIFDPDLRKRDGTFIQYLRSDLNSYHVSYWAGDRGTSQLRKNFGAYVVAVGDDLIANASPEAFQTVRIYKRLGMIRVTVDGVLAIAYDDDGVTHGPVWEHSGWIGLRQMSHAVSCEYDYLSVWPLTPNGSRASSIVDSEPASESVSKSGAGGAVQK